MPYFRQVGKLPAKRRTLFPKPEGGFYAEELVGEDGFSQDLSHVYHQHPPTAIVDAHRVETPQFDQADNWPVLPRHFRTQDIAETADLVTGRKPLLTNADVALSFARSTGTSPLFRDADGAECVYVHQGSGTLRSMFGDLSVIAGQYVVIPVGVIHQWIPGDAGISALFIESRGHIKAPRRHLSDAGQFLEMAPFRERDLRVPEFIGVVQEGETEVLIRRDRKWTSMTFRNHPFDLVGWNGCVYPYALSVYDIEPVVGKIHQPPPVHQTFAGDGFVVCTFVPRLSDYDASAVGGPANHMNIDSDEVMFYAGGNYASRGKSGIDVGSISLHPSGWTHGPQRQPDGKRTPGIMLDEVAVMIDTFKPLQIAQPASDIEAPDYFKSWDTALEGNK